MATRDITAWAQGDPAFLRPPIHVATHGGGAAGAFAAGALYVLSKFLPPADVVLWAASSNALDSAAFAAGQMGDALRGWRFLGATRVIDLSRPSSIISLPLLRELIVLCVGIDVRRLRKSACRTHVAVTDAATGIVERPDLRGEADPIEVLLASSALPGATSGPVQLGGRGHFFDGGAGPYDLDRIEREGAGTIITLFNRKGPKPRASRLARLTAPLWMRGLRAPARAAWLARNEPFNRAWYRAFAPEAARANYIAVRPADDDPLPGLLGASAAVVNAAISAGARRMIEALYGPPSGWPDVARRCLAEVEEGARLTA